jgi:hypothetical protein
MAKIKSTDDSRSELNRIDVYVHVASSADTFAITPPVYERKNDFYIIIVIYKN